MTADAQLGLVSVLVLAAASACVPDGGRADHGADLYSEVLAAEDARPSGGPRLETLNSALGSEDPVMRMVAVRSLGRLEDPAFAGQLTPALDDPDPQVRSAAAHAIAQSLHRGNGEAALEALTARAGVESDSDARRELARSLGRLDLGGEATRRAVSALLDVSRAADVETSTLVGVALALESLSRTPRRDHLGPGALARLQELSDHRSGKDREDVQAARVRTLSLSALGQTGRLGPPTLLRALDDPAVGVRVTALRFGGALSAGDRRAFYRRALSDPAPTVRIAAAIGLASGPRTAETCADLTTAATSDDADGVRVLALDALGERCLGIEDQLRVLDAVTTSLESTGGSGWQVPAHAFLSLVRIDPARGDALLPRFAGHPNHFVRSYAARAAGLLGTESVLRALARDAHPNVRSAALTPLFAARGHDVDALLLEQLSSDDPQLLMIASALLEGSPLGVDVASEALGAFERISEARRETWRDARRALLERIAELGDGSLTTRLEPFLRDYDALVAGDVAGILTAWTGTPWEPRPQPLPSLPLPTITELEELSRTTVTLHMLAGGEIVIRPLPELAPTNAFRFVRLARSGYFDGTTFHRWAPNFVIQGGSPGANEYAGDGAYTRDEVGRLSHWRGTVGLSTRGHDTGDGQIFINLIDNVRLDHDYTIYGEVISGMDVVDSVLEGDVIERAEVRVGP